MSFKCSVFGHSFGDPVVDREREEAGSEVVITIRETQTCSRCGEERVVSENKEVTTLETPDEPAGAGDAATADAAGTGDASPTDDAAATGDATATGDADATASADQAGPADGDDAVVEAGADASGETAAADADDATDPADGPTVAESTAEMDDATIIEESPEQSIVEEAEPEGAEVAADAPEATAGGGTEETDDDAVILDEEAADDADEGDRQPGEWPEEPDDDGPEWSPPTDVSSAAEDDVADEQASKVEPTADAVTVPDGIFRCHECGFTTAVESSSLREGDFCPDCHTGTLVHEPDE